VGRPSDVFSLALVFVEILTNRTIRYAGQRTDEKCVLAGVGFCFFYFFVGS
jgi:hypothetical protein